MNGIPIFPKMGNTDITRDVIHSQWPVGFRALTSVCVTYNGMMCTLCAIPSIVTGHFFLCIMAILGKDVVVFQDFSSPLICSTIDS